MLRILTKIISHCCFRTTEMCEDWRKRPEASFRSLLHGLGLRSNRNMESWFAAELLSSGWLYGWKSTARALFISHLCKF